MPYITATTEREISLVMRTECDDIDHICDIKCTKLLFDGCRKYIALFNGEPVATLYADFVELPEELYLEADKGRRWLSR